VAKYSSAWEQQNNWIHINDEIKNNVGFEVFTALVMKSIIFWDMTPCCPLRVQLNGLHGVISQKMILFKSRTD
jgi:hypothetical protein